MDSEQGRVDEPKFRQTLQWAFARLLDRPSDIRCRLMQMNLYRDVELVCKNTEFNECFV